jgi:DNA-directed RNA polymerase omega subunit
MGQQLSLETLYAKTHSVYKLVVMASRRAIELNAGASQLTQAQKNDIISTALHEIAEGKVSFRQLKT